MNSLFRNLCTLMFLVFCTTGYLPAQWTKVASLPAEVNLSDVYAKGSTIFAVGTRFSDFTPYIFVSMDGGKSWDSTSRKSGYFHKTIAFNTENNGYIAGYGSVSFTIRTTDGGNDWQAQMTDYEHSGITEIQFLNATVGYACGYGKKQFTTGNVYKTTDGGNTWKAQNNPMDSLPLESIQMLDETYGFAWAEGLFGYAQLVRTTDGGEHWAKVYSPTTTTDFYWWNAAEGIGVDARGDILKSNDSGATWQKKSSPSNWLESVCFIDKKIGYAVGAAGMILRTTDGGDTWKKETSSTSKQLTKVEYHDGNVYAIGDGIILRRSVVTDVNEHENNDLVDNQTTLSLYPNPVKAIAHCVGALPGEQVSVFDMYGKLLLSDRLDANSGIDLQSLAKGVYTLHVANRSAICFVKE